MQTTLQAPNLNQDLKETSQFLYTQTSSIVDHELEAIVKNPLLQKDNFNASKGNLQSRGVKKVMVN